MLEKVVLGAIWLSVSQWVVRILGVISIIILARYLSPYDYGIMALINISTGFIESLAVIGVGRYIVAKQELSLVDINTAWTLNVIKILFVALLIFMIAPYAAIFYNKPEIKLPMQIIAFGIAVSSFESIGPALLRKELKFNKVTLYLTVPKLVGTIANIAFAISLKSYWALVIGAMVMRLGAMIVSYFIHPYRPKFSIESLEEIWLFTKLSLLSNFSVFLRNKLDSVLVGKFYSAELLGQYSMAQTVGSIPSTDIVQPLVNSLIPSLSLHRANSDYYRESIIKGLYLISLLVWPICFGFIYISSEFVGLVLSDQWNPVLRYLPVIIVVLSTDVFTNYFKNILILEFQLGFAVKVEWVLVVYYCLAFSLSLYFGDIMTVLWAKLVGSILIAIIFFVKVNGLIIHEYKKMAFQILKPACCSIIATVIAVAIFSISPALGLLATILGKMAVWGGFYVLTIFSLWFIMGTPQSIEKDVFSKIFNLRSDK